MDYKKGGIQGWARGFLEDSRPLEVLYEKHPETSEGVVILKANQKIIVAKRTLNAEEMIWLLVQSQLNTEV